MRARWRLDTPFQRLQHFMSNPAINSWRADADAVDSAKLARYSALLRISKTLSGHKTMAELFEVLADQLHAIVPFDYLALLLHDEPTSEMRLVVLEPMTSCRRSPRCRFPSRGRGNGLGNAAGNRDGHPGGRTATSWPCVPPQAGTKGGVLAAADDGAPARRRSGVRQSVPGAYTDDIAAFMAQIAAVVAIAMDNGINWEQAQRYKRDLLDERDRLRFLLDVNNLLVSHLDHRSLLEAICEAVKRVIDADHIGVGLCVRESGQVRLEFVYNKTRGFSRPDITFPLDRSIAGLAIERGAAGVFLRPELEDRGWDGEPLMKEYGIESVCCVPLVTRNGPLGALYVGSARPDAFSENDVTLLGQTSAQIAIALENARAYEEVADRNAQLIDEKQYLERELHHEFAEIIGTSVALRRVLKSVKTVAPADSTVLLLGETGTGKELIAHAIHNLSRRRDRTFVRMNVAALPPGLLESELFGHEKGAFTGATARRTGRLELAHRARCSWTRSAISRRKYSPSCCASCRSASSNASAAREPSGWTCGSSRPRTATSCRWSKTIGQIQPLLSPECLSDDDPAIARSCRRHSRAGAAFRAAVFPAHGARGSIHPGEGDGRTEAMELAGQHPGAAECHRAGRDPVGAEPRAPAAGRSADGPACRLERETCRDVQPGRTRGDSPRVEGIGRRHRRPDRGGRAAGTQPHHPALEDAAAGHSAALLLVLVLSRLRRRAM